MDPESFDLTNQIATDYKIIKNPATQDAYRTDLAEAAIAELEDDDDDVAERTGRSPRSR